MPWPPSFTVSLPPELSDETVAQLLESLHELARALENHYAAELLRYYHRDDPRQGSLFAEQCNNDDDDLPF